ncbi:hypothetical protein ASF58_22775 [Methylobacterium sp. Leaf125]|uniref:hypothetical protein n=1 Tax=Methylobacterium sp. Leaf125 TaxID=1736265 RepID=UPI0006F9DE17|nr:hypothetical protein [Methylobacterium sp. Leaf125]KQQ39120.1 hypothetical protein ASF58_22775 [Methylobacterium sp. Leaf125]
MSSGINFGLPATDLGGGLAGIGRLLALSSEQERKRALSGQVGSAIQSGDYAGAAKAAFDAGDADTGLGLVKLGQAFKKQELEQKASEDFAQGLGGMFGQSAGGAMGALNPSGGGSPTPTRGGAVSFGDSAGPSSGYLASLMTREANNNPTARNPNSTATGLGQFTEGTWTDLARRRPELGLTPGGRTDPDQARRATAAFTQENEGLLAKVGLPVTDVTRYAMHFLGKRGGVQFLKGAEGNPDTPASSYADPSAVAANRTVFFNRNGTPKTARDVLGDFSRSFAGRSGGGGAPARTQVAYADDEAQTQALEQRMGMTPPSMGTQTAQADMPAPGAQEAAFYIPGTEPGVPARSPFGGNQRAPDLDRSSIGNAARARAMPTTPDTGAGVPAPTSFGGGADGAPVMTLPGEGPAPGSAPVQVADAGGSVGNIPAAQIAQSPLGQRIPFLLKAAGAANLPDHQRQLAQSLLKQALDESRVPDAQKDYLLARSQGFSGSYLDYQRELKRPGGPTVLKPGDTVYDERSNSARYSVPERSRSNVTEDVEARRATAAENGLVSGSPAYQSYVLTGKMPREDAQPLTAGDKKAIQEADTAVLGAQSTIEMLGQAKKLSKQAYEGPTAGFRGAATSLFGNEAGVATQDLDNLVTTQALQNLKSIFGGNPTEGERAILLDIQGSSSKPDVVRQRIYDRAIGLANLRLQQNQEKAAELRGQTYYKPGSGPRGQGDAMRASPPSREAPSGSAGQARALPAPSQANRPNAVAAPDRFQQLMGSGLSKQQAYERLQQEGY